MAYLPNIFCAMLCVSMISMAYTLPADANSVVPEEEPPVPPMPPLPPMPPMARVDFQRAKLTSADNDKAEYDKAVEKDWQKALANQPKAGAEDINIARAHLKQATKSVHITKAMLSKEVVFPESVLLESTSRVNIYQWVSQFRSSECHGPDPHLVWRDVPIGSCVRTTPAGSTRHNYDKVTVSHGKYSWIDYDVSSTCSAAPNSRPFTNASLNTCANAGLSSLDAGYKVFKTIDISLKPKLNYNCSTGICIKMISAASYAASWTMASILIIGIALLKQQG